MENEKRDRQFLAISTVSRLGECETIFANSFIAKPVQTKAMENGTKMHEELKQREPKMTTEDAIWKIRAGHRFTTRERLMVDPKYRFKGYVDCLEFTGNVVDGKNDCVVVDDKYTRMVYDAMPLNYELQLAAYAEAVGNSVEYGEICRIIGARLVCRRWDNHEILKEFEVTKDELDIWRRNIPLAAKVAWVLYKEERKPRHMKLDIGTGEWVVCRCGNR